MDLWCLIGKANCSKSRGLVCEVDVQVQVKNEDQPAVATSFHLSNVLYTASGTNNLLSLDKLEKDGWDFASRRSRRVRGFVSEVCRSSCRRYVDVIDWRQLSSRYSKSRLLFKQSVTMSERSCDGTLDSAT
jgi:hypothetical protein